MKRYFTWIFLFFCLYLQAQTQSELPILKIGGDYNYPPYEFINEAGEPDGYNVELSRAICAKLGYQPEFNLAKWSLVREWLDSGEIDLIQGMAFSLERAQSIHFSDAHTMTWRAIFTRKNSNIQSEADLKGKNVVVQKKDVALDYLRLSGFKGTSTEVPTQEDALSLLADGDFDAAIVNYMMGMHIIQKRNFTGLSALPQRIHQREYCYASHDDSLIVNINTALRELSTSGELIKMQDKWFAKLEYAIYRDSRFLKALLTIAIPLLIILAAAVVYLSYLSRRLRFSKNALAAQLKKTTAAETEIRYEYDTFSQGPVILYKLQKDPILPLKVSENISIWGYSSEDIVGKGDNFSEVMYSEDRERVLDQLQNQKPNIPKVSQYRAVTKNGEIRWVLDYCRLLSDAENTEQYYYGYLMDVTDQKRLEAQLLEAKERAEAANIAKSHFLANMSHEIRTPLNGINGFLQVLMQMDATEQQREFYEIMYSSSKNLMKIINDILDFSKIESGKMELIFSDFNPRYLVEDIAKQFSFQTRKKELSLQTSIAENIPNVLKGDQLRLKQILINLLQNAIKFTDSGVIELGAEIYTTSDTDVRILFKVADTGIGIDPVKQKDIFDNYSQADSSITSKYGGTGLGLAIVKRLVEMMQGFIWVDSELGKGSCFFFILPFKAYNELPENIPDLKMPEKRSDQKIYARVLVVEDEHVNQIVTKLQLEGWGLDVTIANTGSDAVQMHLDRPFDMILMDIQMPVMDGITATQKIRKQEETTGRHTPIIAFTAAALVGDRERFLAAGMDDYIAKPIEMDALYNILAINAEKGTK